MAIHRLPFQSVSHVIIPPTHLPLIQLPMLLSLSPTELWTGVKMTRKRGIEATVPEPEASFHVPPMAPAAAPRPEGVKGLKLRIGVRRPEPVAVSNMQHMKDD